MTDTNDPLSTNNPLNSTDVALRVLGHVELAVGCGLAVLASYQFATSALLDDMAVTTVLFSRERLLYSATTNTT